MTQKGRQKLQQRKDLTFGLEPPANPAFIVAVPLSITIGWFKSKLLELGSDAAFPPLSSVEDIFNFADM